MDSEVDIVGVWWRERKSAKADLFIFAIFELIDKWVESFSESYICMVLLSFHTFFQKFFFQITLLNIFKLDSQPAIACSKLTIETLEQGVKYVQS